MVGELDILNEWIPEQMQPGTVFVLENAGEVGEKEDPYWAVLACPSCGMLGLRLPRFRRLPNRRPRTLGLPCRCRRLRMPIC